MDSSEILVLCSNQPGFLRYLVPRLVTRCRLLECYTVAEAAQLAQVHRPHLLLVDVGRGDRLKLGRALAIAHNIEHMQLIVASHTTQVGEAQIPEELTDRVTRVVLHDDNPEHLVGVVEELLSRDRHSTSRSPATASPLTTNPDAADDISTQSTPDPTPRNNAAPHDSATPAASARPANPTSGMSLAARFQTQTPELRQILDRVEVAARHDVTILLIGETGSGKTHLARLIHESSGRGEHPFLTVACGALPGDLIESELFGHVKGAFTGAHADKEGKFIAAGEGTILLDEIDVLTPDQQVKLLRVIEQGLFEAVGSNQTLQVQARIIAASNLPLEPLVEQQQFRPDLYYRLNTLCFRIPPLRSRLPDIQPLARYFAHLHARRHNVEITHIEDDFYDCLQQYPWPGNVREMENSIRGAVIYCADGRLNSRVLPPNIVHGASGPTNDPSVAAIFSDRPGRSLGNRIELTERDIIEQALQNNSFSRTQTARQLGISRVTLYNKMKKYDMMPRRNQ